MIELFDYETRPVCLEALEIIRRRFRQLEEVIPPATWVPWGTRHNWRFTEQLTSQVLLQKLARQISGVQTIDLLLLAGRLQEIGVLYRVLDEIDEDILFLMLGVQSGDWTANHDQYVKYFWSEDDGDKQPPVQRKKIRAFVHRASGVTNPSAGDAAGRLIHKTYSDYVHARSAPIMGMVKGPPARFDLGDIHDEQAIFPYVDQNPTYFYRCLMSICAVSIVLLSELDRKDAFDELRAFESRHRTLLFGAHGGSA